jgi:hypothetical protein
MKRFAFVLMLMAMVFSAGSAMALNLNDHVTMAPNAKGDLLFVPFYVAVDGGWETKINVINTSLIWPVVAKVVVRSLAYSRELLDFFIYLSPTDVWTGTLEYGPNGPRMVSTDDSVQVAPGVFASPENPLQRDLTEPCPEDTNQFGYVEIFEAWSTLDGPDTEDGVPPIPKADVKAAFEAATSFSAVVNVLTVNYEVTNKLAAVTASDQGTILKDYNVNTGLDLGIETLIGQNANNDMCEVEAALSKNNLAMYYYNTEDKVALHVVTFPTKLTDNANCGACEDVLSEYFLDNFFEADCWSAEYGLRYWDLSENSPGSPNPIFSPVPPEDRFVFPYEVNFVGVFDFIYDEGWTLYKFINTVGGEDPVSTTCAPLAGGNDTITFTGAPAIPSTLFLGADGMSLMGAAYDYGTVQYNTAPVTHYQLKEGGDPAS